MKLWISENNFVEIDDRESLAKEIAPRSQSLDWLGIMGFLPDPDPVLRKLGQDMTVYRQLLSDAHVWSCYQSRKAGVLSCEWEIIESATGGARPNKQAYQMISDMMAEFDVYQINTDMLDAPFYGMSPIEIIWNADNHKWLPERIIGKPPEWFMFDPENNLRFKSIEDMIEGEEIPKYKFLLPRHHASYQNPYGERVLSRCFWPITFKKGGFKFWSIFTEKFGMPWIIGKVPRSTNETERSSLLTNLTSMVQDAVAVINDDESVDITEASGKKASADIYDKLIEAGNKEVSKAIQGQTASTEGTPGKLGDEHAQIATKEDIIDSDKQMVCSAWNQLFRWITELNFAGANPPVFGFYEEEDVRKTRSERDTELSNQGVRFTKTYYQRMYNLEKDDFEIGVPLASAGETEKGRNGETGKVEFAEGDADIHTADILTKKALADASMDELIEPAKKLLSQVNSLKEFRDGLVEIYAGMDDTQMGNLMQQALALAELSGRFDASDR